ncbi:Gfo/Idh/MocA family protein [Roseivirga sp.]|uniref:Gfo/Idh/MocA family protein n=1 Tax=Roseivirga sp. TaxID=1964215 RepID=UPI003B8B1534
MNWGFIGFGRIARKFLESLESVDGEIPYAFASRSNAVALQEEFPGVKVYDSYESLLADDNIDVVYISTTHNFHCDNTIAALKAGKHVLCEKPMGISSQEIAKMTEVAKSSGKFLMEAMWMRFLPAYKSAINCVKSGEIGKVNYATASFGFRSEDKLTKEGRLLNPELAGGALYDVGVYPLTIISDLFGWKPQHFAAHAIKSETGVDETIQIQFDFGNNKLAQVMGSVTFHTNKEACIYGDKGFVRMPMFWKADSYEIVKGDDITVVELPYKSTGYAHEIEEVVSCIGQGKVESPLFSLNDSLMSAQLVEEILSTIFK